MVVDGSKLVRRLIGDVLHKELPNVEVVGCSGLEQARAALDDAPVDLVTTALVLPDGDGMQLAHAVREAAAQRYVPVIVVSGDAQSRLESRSFTDDVTRSEEHTSELQSLMRISYAVFCLNKKNTRHNQHNR